MLIPVQLTIHVPVTFEIDEVDEEIIDKVQGNDVYTTAENMFTEDELKVIIGKSIMATPEAEDIVYILGYAMEQLRKDYPELQASFTLAADYLDPHYF